MLCKFLLFDPKWDWNPIYVSCLHFSFCELSTHTICNLFIETLVFFLSNCACAWYIKFLSVMFAVKFFSTCIYLLIFDFTFLGYMESTKWKGNLWNGRKYLQAKCLIRGWYLKDTRNSCNSASKGNK